MGTWPSTSRLSAPLLTASSISATRAAGGVDAAIISNNGAATPDIETDLLAAAASKQPVAEFLSLMTTAVANDAAAQALLLEGLLFSVNLTPLDRASQSTFWCCDGRADATSGNPTLVVAFDESAAGGADGDACVVEIVFLHTLVR